MLNRREFLQSSAGVLAGLTLTPISRAFDFSLLPRDASGQAYAEGYVFHDLGGLGIRREGDPGVAGVCVSNGRQVVRTDRNGKWRLPVSTDTILFVIKPSGWMVPVNENQLPQHYYIHKPAGSPEYRHKGVAPTGDLPKSIDFPLLPQRENSKFRMVLFGDPQPRNQKEIDYIAHDVVEQVVRDAAAMNAKFGISLGDIMFDDLSLYDSLNRTVSAIGLPWYNLPGNHDMNFDSVDDNLSTETFQRIYGPTYYSFNYGKVHFILLDNVIWHGKDVRGYHGEISERQLEFVKNDLLHVPKDHLVVISMHIPLVETQNREALYRLIEDRKHTLSFSAHTHVQRHYFLTQKDGWNGSVPHHHLNHATVCGSWWEGAPDERGIPHATMSDGGPNGYSFLEFDGNRYMVTFRAASRPEQDQMAIWLPEEISRVSTDKTEVIVNVWAGSDRSKVEMRMGTGAWVSMTQFTGQDPFYLELKELEKAPVPPPGLKLPAASDTPHLWKAPLPSNLRPGTYRIEVRTTDMFGQSYNDFRTVRVV
jgi:hypothetical protein